MCRPYTLYRAMTASCLLHLDCSNKYSYANVLDVAQQTMILSSSSIRQTRVFLCVHLETLHSIAIDWSHGDLILHCSVRGKSAMSSHTQVLPGCSSQVVGTQRQLGERLSCTATTSVSGLLTFIYLLQCLNLNSIVLFETYVVHANANWTVCETSK